MEELSSLTVSQREQFLVENDVFGIYNYFDASDVSTQKYMMEIQRDKQLDYLMKGLRQLGPQFSSLDANRPWLCYWILHSIALLGETVDDELESNAIDFLGRCQGSEGGYGGGPGQLPHLATTYAAVNALVTLGGDKALSSINREKMSCFLRRMKDTSGGFRMHDMGEMDVRACYTAISVASILNIMDDELTQGLGDYILSCQTYEGGIGGEPGSEAHGGYGLLLTSIMLRLR
jgi:protein farnesyltransferase subunit beta